VRRSRVLYRCRIRRPYMLDGLVESLAAVVVTE
jgi:hypothetical protein